MPEGQKPQPWATTAAETHGPQRGFFYQFSLFYFCSHLQCSITVGQQDANGIVCPYGSQMSQQQKEKLIEHDRDDTYLQINRQSFLVLLLLLLWLLLRSLLFFVVVAKLVFVAKLLTAARAEKQQLYSSTVPKWCGTNSITPIISNQTW